MCKGRAGVCEEGGVSVWQSEKALGEGAGWGRCVRACAMRSATETAEMRRGWVTTMCTWPPSPASMASSSTSCGTWGGEEAAVGERERWEREGIERGERESV